MLISIIVPVYNAKPYLDKCIQSILLQTYEAWELILIDDGSTDGSAAICEKYAEINQKVVYYHQENAGVCKARNVGMTIAKGEYVSFVDADDWLDKDYLKILLEDALERDWVACEFENVWEDSNKRIAKSTFDSDRVFNEDEVRRELTKTIVWNDGKQKFTNPVCKLYKKELIDNYLIRFPTGIKLYEDMLFNIHYAQYAKNCKYIHKILYYRRMHIESAIHQYRKNICQEIRDVINVYNQLKEEYNLEISDAEKHLTINLVTSAFRFNVFRNSQKGPNKYKCIYHLISEEPMKSFWNSVKITDGFDWKEQIIIGCIKCHMPFIYEWIYKGRRVGRMYE